MTIIRVQHDKNNPYVTINKDIHNVKISLRAKAIYFYAFSRPDDWQFYSSQIASTCTEGVDAVNTALKELENVGYLHREQKRDENGKFKKTDWIFYETPREIQIILPQRDFPGTAIPDSAKPPLLSNNPLPSKESKLASRPSSDSKKDSLIEKAELLKDLELTQEQIMHLCKNNSQESILKAIELLKTREPVDNAFAWLNRCMREKWWLEAKPSIASKFLSLKLAISEFLEKNDIKANPSMSDTAIHINTPKGGIEIHKEKISDDKYCTGMAGYVSNSFKCTHKLIYDTISSTKGFKIC